MRNEKRLFFKGFNGFTRASDELEYKEAWDSAYYWWWRFMRLSPVFWFANQTGHMPVLPEMVEAFRQVGNLDQNFVVWWRETGRFLFSEAKRPAKVQKLDLDTLQEHEFCEGALLLEIPLSIRKETIIKQVRLLLEDVHEGRSLDLAATSTAQLKLHTKRYRLRTLETEYWVLLYKILFPEASIWQIGDRLRIAPQLRVRGVERGANERMFANMNSLVGRYLYKARFTLGNVELGIFPNADDPNLDEDLMPFGAGLHAQYAQATKSDGKSLSAWQEWLMANEWPELKRLIVRKNRLADSMRMPDSVASKRFSDFVAGRTDEIS